MEHKIPFAKKIALCFTLSLLSASTLLLLGTDMGAWINPKFIFIFAAVLFMLPLSLLPLWQYFERRQSHRLSNLYSNGQDLIAFIIAFCLFIFGWKKIFGMQFRTPMSIADQPMSSQSGETLTWYYFGHSPVFGIAIAVLQLAGAFLLFPRKTRLLGIFILLPVMLNITLINIFYQMNPGALLQSVVLTSGLLYLMFFYYQGLLQFFFKTIHHASDNKKNKWALATVGLTVTFLFIRFSSSLIPKEPPVFGAYDIASMMIDNKVVKQHFSSLNDSVPVKLYFDQNNVCVIKYSEDRQLIANYTYHPADRTIDCSFTNERRSQFFHVAVNRISNKAIILKGSLGNDSLQMLLIKTQ